MIVNSHNSKKFDVNFGFRFQRKAIAKQSPELAESIAKYIKKNPEDILEIKKLEKQAGANSTLTADNFKHPDWPNIISRIKTSNKEKIPVFSYLGNLNNFIETPKILFDRLKTRLKILAIYQQ